MKDLKLPQTLNVGMEHEVFDHLKIDGNAPVYLELVFSAASVLLSQVCCTMLAMAMKTMGTVSWFLLMLQIPTDLQTVCACRTSSN